jgi:hypothetical protein
VLYRSLAVRLVVSIYMGVPWSALSGFIFTRLQKHPIPANIGSGSNLFQFPAEMVNFQDPAKVAHDFCACHMLCHLAHEHDPNELTDLFTVAVVKLWHTVDGLYMWVCPLGSSPDII